MSAPAADEPLKERADDDGTEQAKECEEREGATGQGGPSATDDNASYTTSSQRLSCIAYSRQRGGRGRFRDLDAHASWREVYFACDVDGWGHE